MHVGHRGDEINQQPSQQTPINRCVHHVRLIASASSAMGTDKILDCGGGIDYISSYRPAPGDDSLSGDDKFCTGEYLALRKTMPTQSVFKPVRGTKGLPQQTTRMIAEFCLCKPQPLRSSWHKEQG